MSTNDDGASFYRAIRADKDPNPATIDFGGARYPDLEGFAAFTVTHG